MERSLVYVEKANAIVEKPSHHTNIYTLWIEKITRGMRVIYTVKTKPAAAG
jgi:hypothetical protein